MLNTIAFVVFCMAVGYVMAAFATSLVYDVDAFEISEAPVAPINSSDKRMVMLSAMLYTLFSFLIIPVIYLSLVKRQPSFRLMHAHNIQVVPLSLSVVTAFTIAPFISVLIDVNQNIQFPMWLSDVERYLKESEGHAQQLASLLYAHTEWNDVMMAMFVMAIVPGIAEELFFRGIVQTELQSVFKSRHIAILTSAFLFSFFHFQFYGFIPRFALGILLGYLFFSTGNIWYSCAAHVVTNAMSIVVGYGFVPLSFPDNIRGELSLALVLPSVALTVYVVLFLKKLERTKALQTPV